MGAISSVVLLALLLSQTVGQRLPAPSAGTPAPAALPVRPAPKPSGRLAFTTQSFTAAQSGPRLPGFTEMVLAGTFASPNRDEGGTEYRFDFRGAGYPQTAGRNRRMSVYDAYVGQRFAGGGFAVRGGQMWLNDLGGLGALGGVLGEVTRRNVGPLRRVRVGGFGGLEPQILDVGYVPGVTKAGGYMTLEGNGIWRNTVGFVMVRNSGLTERAVLTTTNFMPFGRRVLVYQAAEYDLRRPAGSAAGLSYLFANARYLPSPFIEFQGIYHRGRSIDIRGITLDQLAGRPVNARALEGLLYESIGGRATVTIARDVRLFAGYTKDRNNREDAPTARVSFGGIATNLLRTGLDVNVSDARMRGPSASYDSWDVSVGRSLGWVMYVTADYTTSLSAFQLLGQEAFVLQARPRTNRYSVSDLIRLTKTGRVSLLVSGDRTRDGDLSELRWLASLIWRF